MERPIFVASGRPDVLSVMAVHPNDKKWAGFPEKGKGREG